MAAGEKSELSRKARRLLDEEEALLARLRGRLAELSGGGPPAGVGERLVDLRDEAATARSEDLPSLLGQMHVARAVGDRRRTGALPDPACPYFAHLRLREGDAARDYLLGHVTFLDAPSGLRILDWRNAPLARLFYRYREGDDYDEELPGRRAEGTIEARRLVVIAAGRLRAVHAQGLVVERAGEGWIERDASGPALAGGAGTAERGRLGLGVGREGRAPPPDIAALLDPIQSEIVHACGEGPLLVLGSAGSGKTTVALHRLAALCAKAPQRFGPRHVEVIVPEPGLARLAARILAPLGLGDVRVTTFDAWARREVVRLMPELPRRSLPDAPVAVSRLKRHRALLELIPAWLEERGGSAPPGRLREALLTDRALLSRAAAASGGEIPIAAVEETIRRTRRQAAVPFEQSLRGVERERLQTIDGRAIDEGTPEEIAQTLDAEDDAILLALWRLTRGRGVRPIAHLVLDEAQDVGPFEAAALRQALGHEPSATVAGDDMQRLDSAAGFSGWDELLSGLGLAGAPRRTLDTGYRCPASISAVAQAILGPIARPGAARARRPGAPVGWHRFPNGGAEVLFLQDALADLLCREPEASIAILTRGPAAAARWSRDLLHLPARHVIGGEFRFEPGIDVCEIAEAKGLEFDYVVVPDADAASFPETDESRRLLHVAATRAMHQLWLLVAATPSPVLPWGRDG